MVSTYVERWNTLLGAIFIIVIIFMPYGLVPGCRSSGDASRGAASRQPASPPRSRPHDRPRLKSTGLNKRFGGLPATKNVSLTVMPGERRLIIGPNGAGKTTLFNLITGDLSADSRLGQAVRAGTDRHADARTACISGSPAPTRS